MAARNWYLFGPNYQQINSSSIGGDLTATLPSTGNYTLEIYNNSIYSSGTYSFEAIENVDPIAPLTLGKTVSGTIANPGDQATYTFTGSPGQRVYFDGLGLPSNVYANLTDPFGNTVFNFASSDSGPYTLSSQGTYSLTVFSYSTTHGTGAYSFALDDLSAATNIALTPGSATTENGTLATGLSTNLYQFSATAGQSVYFEGIKDSPSSGALATLYNRSNGSVASFYVENDDPVTLATTGTYLLAVAGQNAANSSVTYSFEVFDNLKPTTALMLGKTVTGTIADPGDQAIYTFTGSPGQRIFFDSLGLPSNVYASLTDPFGNQVFNFASGDSAPATLSAQGTYSLSVFSYSTTRGTGAFSFALDDISTATNIALTSGAGTTESGTLATGLATNLYQFSGTAGQSLYFEGLKDSPASGAVATLFNRSNGSLGSVALESDRQFTLPSTGTYLLAVAGQNASNSSVSYSFEAFTNVDPITALTLGKTVTGTIANPGDQAIYTFTGSPGQRVYFDSQGIPTNVYASLTDPFGNQVFNFASGDSGPYTLSSAGSYALSVFSYSTSRGTGAFSFALDDISTATNIALTSGAGTTESGTLATGLATNLYQFSGTAGQSLYFEGLKDSPASGAVATLFNRSNGSLGSFALENDRQFTLPSTGTYLLAVAGQNASNSSVSYSFEAFDNVDPTTALLLGKMVTGTIANPGDQATYTFTGSPGQRVYFDSQGFPTNVYASLTDPFGNQLFNFATGDSGPYTLSVAGTYSLSVFSYSTSRGTGSYAFALDDISAATNVNLTAGSGTTVTGTLTGGLSTNLYQFSGTAGQSVYFKGLQDVPASGATVTLFNPSNGSLGSFDPANDRQFPLPSTGTYLLVVAGQNAANTSVNYSFEAFANIDPTSSLTLGQMVSGTIANPGDAASYTFTGTPGQRIFFDGLGTAISNLNAILTDPYGNTVFNTGAASDAGPYTLTWPGTYTLSVYSNSTSRATAPLNSSCSIPPRSPWRRRRPPRL